MIRLTLTLLTIAAAAPGADTERYFFGFLKSAPNRPALPKEEAAKIQGAHLAHLGAMGMKGVLACAGPLANGGELRGVLIYKTATVAEAKEHADADPAVKAGLLVSEFVPWTGPKGIGEAFMRKFREAGGKMEMKIVKYRLVVTKPGAEKTDAKALVRGPYADGGATGEILVLAADSEAWKTFPPEAVRVSLDWYVADGVLTNQP